MVLQNIIIPLFCIELVQSSSVMFQKGMGSGVKCRVKSGNMTAVFTASRIRISLIIHRYNIL